MTSLPTAPRCAGRCRERIGQRVWAGHDAALLGRHFTALPWQIVPTADDDALEIAVARFDPSALTMALQGHSQEAIVRCWRGSSLDGSSSTIWAIPCTRSSTLKARWQGQRTSSCQPPPDRHRDPRPTDPSAAPAAAPRRWTDDQPRRRGAAASAQEAVRTISARRPKMRSSFQA